MKQSVASSGLSRGNILGLPVGLLLYAITLTLPSPEGMTHDAHNVAAVTILMAVWWISECISIAVTALVPFVAYPLLTGLEPEQIASQYGNPTCNLGTIVSSAGLACLGSPPFTTALSR